MTTTLSAVSFSEHISLGDGAVLHLELDTDMPMFSSATVTASGASHVLWQFEDVSEREERMQDGRTLLIRIAPPDDWGGRFVMVSVDGVPIAGRRRTLSTTLFMGSAVAGTISRFGVEWMSTASLSWLGVAATLFAASLILRARGR